MNPVFLSHACSPASNTVAYMIRIMGLHVKPAYWVKYIVLRSILSNKTVRVKHLYIVELTMYIDIP